MDLDLDDDDDFDDFDDYDDDENEEIMQMQGWPSSCFDHHDEDSAADVDYEDDYDDEEEITNARSTSRRTLFSIPPIFI